MARAHRERAERQLEPDAARADGRRAGGAEEPRQLALEARDFRPLGQLPTAHDARNPLRVVFVKGGSGVMNHHRA